jgi:hypothetical protein
LRRSARSSVSIVNGVTPPQDSALTSVGAGYGSPFDGDFAPHSQTYAGAGTIRYTW